MCFTHLNLNSCQPSARPFRQVLIMSFRRKIQEIRGADLGWIFSSKKKQSAAALFNALMSLCFMLTLSSSHLSAQFKSQDIVHCSSCTAVSYLLGSDSFEVLPSIVLSEVQNKKPVHFYSISSFFLARSAFIGLQHDTPQMLSKQGVCLYPWWWLLLTYMEGVFFFSCTLSLTTDCPPLLRTRNLTVLSRGRLICKNRAHFLEDCESLALQHLLFWQCVTRCITSFSFSIKRQILHIQHEYEFTVVLIFLTEKFSEGYGEKKGNINSKK